jgi:hypothetical protein
MTAPDCSYIRKLLQRYGAAGLPRSMFSRHPDAGRGPPFVSAQTNGCGGDNGGITLSSGFCATILEKDRRFGKTRDER